MVEKKKGGDIGFSNLVSTIQDNSAYWLYFHAGGMNHYYDRGQIEDFRKEYRTLGYVRAVHGFPEEMVDNKTPGWIEPQNLPKKFQDKEFFDYDIERCYEIVTFSKFKKKEYEEYEETVEVPTLLSKLGISKPKTTKVKKSRNIDVGKTLYELIGGKNEEAYILTFTLSGEMKEKLTDDIGRHSSSPPKISILTDKETANSTMVYLKKNPEDYHKLIQALFPEQEFPNVNKHFIKNENPLNAMVMYDLEKEAKIVEGLFGKVQIPLAEVYSGLEKKYFTQAQINEKNQIMENPVFSAYLKILTNDIHHTNRGVPLDEIIKKIGNEKVEELFPKALHLRATQHGIMVMVDPDHFNEYLFRALNGPNGDRVTYRHNIPETAEIIQNYFDENDITSIGIENNTGRTLATATSPVIPFTADRHGRFFSPNGHLMVLEKDEKDEIHADSIQNLDEKVITSKVPASRIKMLYVNEDIAEDVRKITGLGENVIGFPWKTKDSLSYFGIPELMVLTAQEQGLAEKRYQTKEEWESAVKKAKEISSSKTYTDYDYTPME